MLKEKTEPEEGEMKRTISAAALWTNGRDRAANRACCGTIGEVHEGGSQ